MADFIDEYSQESEGEKKPKNDGKFVHGVFQFGKYNGRRIDEVFKEDQTYCQWYLKTIDNGSKHKIYVKNKLRELFEVL